MFSLSAWSTQLNPFTSDHWSTGKRQWRCWRSKENKKLTSVSQLYITRNNKYPHSSELVWHIDAFNPRTKRNGLIRTTRSVGLRLKCTMRKFALEDILTELNLEHWGSRCKNAEGEILRSFCDAPGQLNVAKEWQSEHKLRSSTFEEKKKRKKKLAAIPASCSSSWRQAGELDYI